MCLVVLADTSIIYAQENQDSLNKVLRERRNQKEKEVNAEEEKGIDSLSHNKKERIIYGSNFSVSFGSTFLLDISPFCAYRITRRLMAGPGLTYIIYSSRISYSDTVGNTFSYRIHSYIYGGRLFAEYALSRNLFIHGELEKVNVPYADTYGATQRRWIDNQYLGVGYKTYVGKRTFIQIQLLYNFNFKNNQDYNPNTSAIVGRVGFGW
jgi:hypothetical protein